MWLLYALVSFFSWGAADLFYKKSNPQGEKYAHLKTAAVVGLVMGITAVITLITKDLHYDIRNLIIYLPVSSMYILSMTVGYFGLRYLTVSVSSPIQNASGVVSAILLMIVLKKMPEPPIIVAIVLITAGVIALGFFERQREKILSSDVDKKYTIGFWAFMMPIFYCFIDSLGTFFDGWYLDSLETTPLLGVTEETLEDVANVSYQLTFLIAALILMVYVFVIRKQKLTIKGQKNRFFAALLETLGQLTYVYALSGNGIAATPVIGSYCVASLVFGRIFLKEKLMVKEYLAIGLVIAGIIIMGIMEGLSA